MKKKWWQEAIVYQIYCKSFCDSNADGIGDLPGVISKLPQLKELGINCIWLNPIYVSPQVDNGYDVADYRNIDPAYGTLEDFKRLLSPLRSRAFAARCFVSAAEPSISVSSFAQSSFV